MDFFDNRLKLKKDFDEYYEKSLTKKYQPEAPAQWNKNLSSAQPSDSVVWILINGKHLNTSRLTHNEAYPNTSYMAQEKAEWSYLEWKTSNGFKSERLSYEIYG